MIAFLLNMLLAALWLALGGEASWSHLITGLIVSGLAVWWMSPVIGERAYFRKLGAAISLLAFFVKELTISSGRVAFDVVTPGPHRSAAVVTVPVQLGSDAQLLVLVSLIGLTPGTLVLDVSEDRKELYVHGMFVEDVEEFRRLIREDFAGRVREVID